MRLAKKVAAGARFVQTQLIYNVDRFREYMEQVGELGLHEQVYILVATLSAIAFILCLGDSSHSIDIFDHW
jgi:5,10-methylenetetrahydrofolate reductase